ncbi:MAG: GHKL domain-containing protein [Lachnospiraceae bacterium]|nr:GHKL domain-containing protein [Lachnospiraceae bacterium]
MYKEEIQTKNFFTTKKNKDHHGYGLKNVEKLVDENRGILRLQSEGDRFLAEAVFG